MKTILEWFGQSTFKLRVGEQVVTIDPWFNGNPLSPVKTDAIGRVDIITVSHGHVDHFGDTMKIMAETDAKIVCTPDISWYLDLRGFTRASGRNLPLGHGGTITIGNVSITMVKAVHPSALYAEEWPVRRIYYPDGGAVGYVFTTSDGLSVYHAGDTDIFTDMQLIGKRHNLEYALLPIGGRFTMDYRAAVDACEFLRPKAVIPMHYNTFPEITLNENDFFDLMKKKHPDIKVIMMRPGESHCLREN